MKDIKSLYLTAKSSGKLKDVTAYTEGVREILESNPNDYISNLEYIISSTAGLPTLYEFVETYGLPIACYDNVIACLEKCVRKCKQRSEDSKDYEEAIAAFENFREKYSNCFIMFESFKDALPKNYVETYYGFNEKGIQNNKLVVGMIKEFDEAAIPDMLITADKIGESAVDQTLQFLEGYKSTPVYCQWVYEATRDIAMHEDTTLQHVRNIHSKSLEAIVESMKSRNKEVYREAVLTGNDDALLEYTSAELNAVEDLIEFREYQLTYTESAEKAISIYKEIMSLYEEFDGFVNEDGSMSENVVDSVISMLPRATGGQSVETSETAQSMFDKIFADDFGESKWMVNTTNKKTGDIPGYLKNNHNLGYGEDDVPTPVQKPQPAEDPEPSLDDFKRPSAKEEDPIDTGDTPDDEKTPEEKIEDDKRAINNYYYYTYNNSLNRNANSFNRSRTDDHSVHDDHSIGKRIRSDNINSDDDQPQKESVKMPWEIDILQPNKSFTEEVGDADKDKPQSDHPVKDILTDIDRGLVKNQQKAKKKIQDIQNAGRAFMKPINRSKKWITATLTKWKDADENNIKEKMADPYARHNLFSAIATAVKAGSLLKAGLLLNPVFLFLTVTRGIGKNKREFRIRNEMIEELKTELQVIDEKIKDADYNHDNAAKYKLMRLKNEINKKLLRVGGTKEFKKII